MITFMRAGRKNTEETLKAAIYAAEELKIRQMVVASTYGDTGLKAASMLEGRGISLVVVTHNVGFKEPGSLEMTRETRARLEEMGARVCTATMPFRNIGTAIRQLQGYSQQDLIANTLRIFGQGIKVCVEIAMMASDAGLITPEEDIVAVAGTGRGADTAAVIAPMPSNRLFDLKVRRVVAKPEDW
jgi:hypothetical protein